MQSPLLASGAAKGKQLFEAVAEKNAAANEELRVWVGSSRTLYGVAAVLLAPVFLALVDRLIEMGALREKELFVRKLTEAEMAQSYEMQRGLFPKDPAPKAKKGEAATYAWGKAPSKEAARNYNSKRDSRGKIWTKETSSRVYGRISGDAAASHIQDSGVRRTHTETLSATALNL